VTHTHTHTHIDKHRQTHRELLGSYPVQYSTAPYGTFTFNRISTVKIAVKA